MKQYLLATYMGEGAAPSSPPSPDEMAAFMKRVADVEQDMEDNGAFVFGGGLFGPDTATVVRYNNEETVTTDGPFIEAKEHIAGFYVINAEDIDEALNWATKVSTAIQKEIEVRPFRATGRVRA